MTWVSTLLPAPFSMLPILDFNHPILAKSESILQPLYHNTHQPRFLAWLKRVPRSFDSMDHRHGRTKVPQVAAPLMKRQKGVSMTARLPSQLSSGRCGRWDGKMNENLHTQLAICCSGETIHYPNLYSLWYFMDHVRTDQKMIRSFHCLHGSNIWICSGNSMQ